MPIQFPPKPRKVSLRSLLRKPRRYSVGKVNSAKWLTRAYVFGQVFSGTKKPYVGTLATTNPCIRPQGPLSDKELARLHAMLSVSDEVWLAWQAVHLFSSMQSEC